MTTLYMTFFRSISLWAVLVAACVGTASQAQTVGTLTLRSHPPAPAGGNETYVMSGLHCFWNGKQFTGCPSKKAARPLPRLSLMAHTGGA